MQYTLPGVPSIYYGDEAGLTGYSDPFCRAAFPWGNENSEITEFYKALGKVRRTFKAFASGEFIPVRADRGFIAFMRKKGDDITFIAVNCNEFWYELPLPEEITSPVLKAGEGLEWEKINIPPKGFIIIENENM